MDKQIYFYPISIKVFLGLLPLGFVILGSLVMLSLLLYFLTAKHMPVTNFIIFFIFILFVIYLCTFGLICLGPIRTNQNYLYHSILKVKWSDIVSIKEINIQTNKRILIVKTRSLNPLSKIILVSSLIINYNELRSKIGQKIGSR